MKNLLIIIFMSASIIAGGKTTYAQDTLLHKYMQSAINNNPALKAKFKEYYAALQKIPQVGALPDPNAVLGYYILPVETRVGSGVANIQLSQSFPWFGTLAAKKDEASRWAAVKFQAFQIAKNDIFYQLKLKYYQLYFIDKSIRSRQDYLTFLHKDDKVMLARIEGGRASLADELRIKMETKENETQQAILQHKWQSLSADFNQFLDRPVHDSVRVTDDLRSITILHDEDVLLDSMVRRNPLLGQLREQDTAYQSQERVARKSGLPVLGLGLSYTAIAATPPGMQIPQNGQDILMPMLSVSIPLYRSKYKAKVEEARLMQESNNLQIEDMKNMLSAELVNALNQYKDAESNLTLYKQLITQAEQTYQILITAYTGGTEAYVEVLRIEEKLLDYRLNLQQALTSQYTALALLNKLTARELQ